MLIYVRVLVILISNILYSVVSAAGDHSLKSQVSGYYTETTHGKVGRINSLGLYYTQKYAAVTFNLNNLTAATTVNFSMSDKDDFYIFPKTCILTPTQNSCDVNVEYNGIEKTSSSLLQASISIPSYTPPSLSVSYNPFAPLTLNFMPFTLNYASVISNYGMGAFDVILTNPPLSQSLTFASDLSIKPYNSFNVINITSNNCLKGVNLKPGDYCEIQGWYQLLNPDYNLLNGLQITGTSDLGIVSNSVIFNRAIIAYLTNNTFNCSNNDNTCVTAQNKSLSLQYYRRSSLSITIKTTKGVVDIPLPQSCSDQQSCDIPIPSGLIVDKADANIHIQDDGSNIYES